MYRINENKRIQRSATLIKDALIVCLQEKDFNTITVSDIQRVSGVSRATFYRIFDNTSDVLTYYCELLMADIINQSETLSFQNHKDFLLFLFQSLLENHLFLEAVFRSSCEDILLNALLNYSMQRHMQRAYPHANEKEMDYLITGICGFLVGILRTWIKHGKQENPEELYAIISRMSTIISLQIFGKFQ